MVPTILTALTFHVRARMRKINSQNNSIEELIVNSGFNCSFAFVYGCRFKPFQMIHSIFSFKNE